MTELTRELPNIRRFDTLPSSPAPEAPGGGRVDAVNITRHVGARQILQKLSLSIEPGELVAIAGGSGAGKTTLLEILAGLQPPSAGEVRHDGVVRGARVGADSRIGYVPQDDIIHLEMPLRRTLRYAARLRLPAAHRPPRRTGSSSRLCMTSIWLTGPMCRSVRCPAASASGPVSPSNY